MRNIIAILLLLPAIGLANDVQTIGEPVIENRCIEGLQYQVSYWRVRTKQQCAIDQDGVDMCPSLETDSAIRAVNIIQVWVPGGTAWYPPQPKTCRVDTPPDQDPPVDSDFFWR